MSAADTLLLTSATTALKLDDDIKLLEALGAMVHDLARLIKDLDGVDSAEALLDEIAKDLDSPEVAAAFKAAGLDEELTRIVAFVGKVKEIENKVPDKYKALLTPLGKFQLGDEKDNLTWSLTSSGDPIVAADRYSIKLGGQASVTFDAAVAGPGPAPAKRLLLQAAGAIDAGVNATAPYQFGGGTLKATASAHVALAYYYAPAGDPLYAVAVAERLPHLVNPFDLGSVWREVQEADRGLDAIVYTFDGDASVGVEVTFADAMGLAAGLVLDAGFKVGVSATLKASYKLALRRETTSGGKPCLRAVLSRNKVDERILNDSLDLVVDVASLTQPVAAALKRALGEWDKVLDKIKPYLSPGDLLRDAGAGFLDKKALALIGNAELREAVVADLKGALGVGEITDSKIAGWLSGQVGGALNRGQVLIDGKTDAAVDRVMALLVKALPASSAYDAKLRALVKDQVDELEKRLKNEVDGLLAPGAAALKNALAKAGASMDGWAATLNGALAPVRDLLKRCDKVFHDILDVAESAARKKVSARLYREEQHLSGEVVELTGDFTLPTDEASAVFKTLVWGKLRALTDLIDGTASVPGFELDRGASSIQRYSQFKSTSGVEIAFLKVLLNATTVASGKAMVKLDGQGDVHVALEGDLTKSLLSWFNRKEVSFASDYKLIQAGLMRQAATGAVASKPSLELDIGALYAEKSLDRADVKDFIDSLASAGLVGPDLMAKALRVYDDWTHVAGPGAKIPGELSAVLRLKDDTLLPLMALSDPPKDPRRHVTSVGYDALVAGNLIKPDRFKQGAGMVADLWGKKPAPTSVLDLTLGYAEGVGMVYGLRETVPTQRPRLANVTQSTDQQERILLDFLNQAFTLKCLSTLIATMGDIYRSRATVAGQAGWDTDRYLKAQDLMTDCTKAWMTVFMDVAHWRRANITETTLAFMRAMANLAGTPSGAGSGLILTMTWNKPGDPRVASFD